MYRKEAVSELWAIIDKEGNVLYSRGGSSSTPKLMVYPDEKSANRALNNSWTKQVIKQDDVDIIRIYNISKKSD